MTVLITGGLGFIGSHAAHAFLELGQPVVAMALPADAPPEFLASHVGRLLSIAAADVSNPYETFEVFSRHKIDSVIHLAGPPIGKYSAGEEYRQNTAGLLNILEAARNHDVRRISIASSIAVYFGLPHGPFAETAQVRLQAAHTIEAFKKAEELMGGYYAKQNGLELICLRLASIYGPGYRSRRHLPAQLVHAAIHGLTRDQLLPADVPPYHADDCATDLCYVKDCARGIQMVHAAGALKHSVYNIGGGQDVTNRRYLEAARSVFGEVGYPLEEGTSEGGWPHSTMRLDRAREDAGYQPTFDIESALADYADWLRSGHAF